MNTYKVKNLKDFDVNIKIELAALWTATTFCFLYGDYFELYTPGKIQSLISGENVLNSPIILFTASAVMVVPPLMILFSIILRPRINRILNIFFGCLFTIMMVLIAIGSLTPWYIFYVFLAIVEATFTFIIVWKAYKWPRQTH